MDRARHDRPASPRSSRGRFEGLAQRAGSAGSTEQSKTERLEAGHDFGFDRAFERVVHDIAHEPQFGELEVVDATLHRRRNAIALHVTIDREGGIDVTTCERIASRINDALDGFPDPYTLEIESAGLDRPLTKPSDYERFAGRDAKIVTTLAIGNAKTHRGRLGGVRGTNVILTRPGGELPIPIATIRSANLEYDVRADLRAAKEREKNR